MTHHLPCLVWWARVGPLSAETMSLLSEPERLYASSKFRVSDQDRSLVAAAVLRVCAGHWTGTPPEHVVVVRRCTRCGGAHGRPHLPDTPLHASVSHSRDWVVVALTEAGPVGVDVEYRTDVDLALLAPPVLAPDETASTVRDFFVMWTRKEAVVKATGDGLHVPLAAVRVGRADAQPLLLEYPGRPELRAQLFDLVARPGYNAAVAVLSPTPLSLVERSFDADLGRGQHRATPRP